MILQARAELGVETGNTVYSNEGADNGDSTKL